MNGAKLYVGNLSYSVTDEQLKELFSEYGEVKQANVIEGKGFGFVEMSAPEDAEKARKALNGSDFKGRALRIEEARPQKPRQSRGLREQVLKAGARQSNHDRMTREANPWGWLIEPVATPPHLLDAGSGPHPKGLPKVCRLERLSLASS